MRSWAIQDPQISNSETIAGMEKQHLYQQKNYITRYSQSFRNDNLGLNKKL